MVFRIAMEDIALGTPATTSATGSALRAGRARSSLSPCRTISGTAAGPARRDYVVL